MYKLRIRKKDVGPRTPFPLLYLFTQAEFPAFRKAFETFIGFNVRNARTVAWDKLRVYRHDNDKVSWGDDFDRKVSGLREVFLPDLIPNLMDPQIKWQAAVPLLTVGRAVDADPIKGLAPDSPAPAYLSSVGNWESTDGDQPVPKPAYPHNAYLVTKERVYVPICMACPRILHHEAGRCHVGDEVCFSALNKFAASNRFAHHINTYEARHGVQPHESADADSGDGS
jgi:hypothetical protein